MPAVTVRRSHVVIRLSASPTEVSLSVSDDGIGFPAESPDGTGLGLRIMKHRARLIDANFEILPRLGGGYALCAVSFRPFHEGVR